MRGLKLRRLSRALFRAVGLHHIAGMGVRSEPWLQNTPQGLYCEPGGFHIDPHRTVEKALVTHGHADHARAGHAAVLATKETLKIMGVRYGDGFAGSVQAAEPGTVTAINGVDVSFHPAGHVLGSAQIAVEKDGLRIVASGDYKRRPDPTCAGFEPVPCQVFITEATFALPVFRHPDDRGQDDLAVVERPVLAARVFTRR